MQYLIDFCGAAVLEADVNPRVVFFIDELFDGDLVSVDHLLDDVEELATAFWGVWDGTEVGSCAVHVVAVRGTAYGFVEFC